MSASVFASASPASVADEYVCWSRMQAEAGQSLEAIIARKEIERRAGGGIFAWGVGNPPSTLVSRLARACMRVPVIFSIMKSKPKAVDVAPTRTFAWRRYIDASGEERLLPPQSLVTSRGDSATGVKRTHYALMCRSDAPLELHRNTTPFHPEAFRNAGGTGAPIGYSQVTALLRRVEDIDGPSPYEVNLKAWLTAGYWIRLTDPVELSLSQIEMMRSLGEGLTDLEWIDFVSGLRSGPPAEEEPRQRRLF